MNDQVITKVKSNIAFIGTGWIGLNRMKSLLDEDICNTVGILEPDEKNMRKAIDVAPAAVIYNSIDELVASNPDGIVIASPSAMHASQTIFALNNGYPVFCQKPLARTADETRMVINAARSADKLLGVDLSYRFTDGMKKIYNSARHEIGEIFAVDLVFNNAYGPDKPWFYNRRLSGGGCLIDLGVHLIDLALWVLDFPEITNVSSTLFSKGKKISDFDDEVVEDYVSAQIETSAGTSIRLVCSWNLPAGQDAEISASFYGDEASALFYNINGSFYDFEAALCHGTRKEIISHPPDEWGGRALIDWAVKLQESNTFRKSAMHYYDTARIIDRIYRRI